jgi:Zc3h12a-like Ribonuclease NYN domain
MGDPSKPTTDRSFPRPEAGRSKRAIVDASNVAHAGEKGARLATLLAVRDELKEEGFEPILIADAALRHQIDDRDGYEQLVESGELQQAPAGTDADYFVLKLAKDLDALVVSNDRFRDGGKLADEAKSRQIRFMVVAGEVVLEKRTKRR